MTILRCNGVFLDTSKDFGKVWRNQLIYKLCYIGVTEKDLDTLSGFLSSRKQEGSTKKLVFPKILSRIFLMGNYTSRCPQDSFLGSLLILFYINDSSNSF